LQSGLHYGSLRECSETLQPVAAQIPGMEMPRLLILSRRAAPCSSGNDETSIPKTSTSAIASRAFRIDSSSPFLAKRGHKNCCDSDDWNHKNRKLTVSSHDVPARMEPPEETQSKAPAPGCSAPSRQPFPGHLQVTHDQSRYYRREPVPAVSSLTDRNPRDFPPASEIATESPRRPKCQTQARSPPRRLSATGSEVTVTMAA
jgi:hypothetical protein